jgi:hypothetical protein
MDVGIGTKDIKFLKKSILDSGMNARLSMRFFSYVLLPMIIFAAIAGCHGRSSGTAAPGDHDPAGQSLRIPDSLAQKAMHTYIGHLGDGLITVVINYISGDVASGYAVQRGRRRNFNGGAQLQGASLHFELETTGDQPEKFEIDLDTLSRKIAGRASQGGEWRQLKGVPRPDTVNYASGGTWVATRLTIMSDFRDSILTFGADGLCDFKFYQRPWDSTSQMITLRGNYEKLGGKEDGYRVEWEENSYLKAAADTMVVKEKKIGRYKSQVLTGNGLNLVRFAFL